MICECQTLLFISKTHAGNLFGLREMSVNFSFVFILHEEHFHAHTLMMIIFFFLLPL